MFFPVEIRTRSAVVIDAIGGVLRLPQPVKQNATHNATTCHLFPRKKFNPVWWWGARETFAFG